MRLLADAYSPCDMAQPAEAAACSRVQARARELSDRCRHRRRLRGRWFAAEQHHLTAIHQTDTAPYRVSQPTAREWYATLLLDRNAPGDAAKARGLFSEALAMYESMGMPFHASRTGRRLATL